MSLVCGCVAIVMAFRGMEQIGSLAGWQWACVFMGFSAVFDFLDGAAARALKAYSKIGAELDSLSDLVAFGVAPAMMMFNLMQYHSVASGHPELQWLSWSALLVPVFGALRLARFNVEDVGTTTFRGLPIPSACRMDCHLRLSRQRRRGGAHSADIARSGWKIQDVLAEVQELRLSTEFPPLRADNMRCSLCSDLWSERTGMDHHILPAAVGTLKARDLTKKRGESKLPECRDMPLAC